MYIILLILGLLFIAFSFNTFSNTSKKITAAADPWPPFVDDKNPSDGLSLEIIRAAYKTQGYEVEMVYVPWARAEAGVKDGTYDILPDVWINEDRKKEMLFSNYYATNDIKFIKQKMNPFQYNGLNSLKGKNIGVIRGYGYDEEFLNSKLFTREEAGNLIQNIRKLIAQRIDLTLEDEIVATHLIREYDLSVPSSQALLPRIEFVKTPLSTNYMYISAGYKNPRHKEIIEAFNKGLKIIKENGTYETIFKKYGINTSN